MHWRAAVTIYLAGHTGLVGSALARRLGARQDIELVTAARAEVDLTDRQALRRWLSRVRPDVVILAAGRVGGIVANATFPAEFIYENLMIEANVIHEAWRAGVKRLLNFGSTCMYPKHCPQPMSPELLMSGPIEPTSEPYAVAKWAGLSLCSSYSRQHGVRFITAIPATVYGAGDSFDPAASHVVSALLRKFHDARQRRDEDLTLWGSGAARRECLYTDDLAEACELVVERYEGLAPVNIGPGESSTVRELAALVAEIVGFEGRVRWDLSRPDGAPEKLLDSTVVRSLGWLPRTSLRAGVEQTYRWFLDHEAHDVSRQPSCASS